MLFFPTTYFLGDFEAGCLKLTSTATFHGQVGKLKILKMRARAFRAISLFLFKLSMLGQNASPKSSYNCCFIIILLCIVIQIGSFTSCCFVLGKVPYDCYYVRTKTFIFKSPVKPFVLCIPSDLTQIAEIKVY